MIPTPSPHGLEPLTESNIVGVTALAHEIWHAHYAAFISEPQLKYMLDSRFTPENLLRYIGSRERWFDLLRSNGELVGYCSYALEPDPSELKLEQLYLLPRLHGRGLGGLMLRHVEVRARALGRLRIVLQVNKHNARSLAVYRASGYEIRTAAVFDIGGGFVMDDYVMCKLLHRL